MNGIKFADSGIVEGYAAPWGSPQRRDLQGEYFDAQTDFQLGWFETRPLILDHGIGRAGAGSEVVGRVLAAEKRADGLWVRCQLDKASRWFAHVRDLLARGSLAFSSATLPHLARVDSDGRIRAWPFVELSLTTSPASSDARITSVKALVDHFGAIGVPPTALKGLVYGAAAPSLTGSAAEALLREFQEITASIDGREALRDFRRIDARLYRRLARR